MTGIPQIIIICLMAMGLGVSLARHGEPRSEHDFGVALGSVALHAFLLWWGGFWG